MGKETVVAYFIGLFWYIVEELSKNRETCLRAKSRKRDLPNTWKDETGMLVTGPLVRCYICGNPKELHVVYKEIR
jgi:hypothetical protein